VRSSDLSKLVFLLGVLWIVPESFARGAPLADASASDASVAPRALMSPIEATNTCASCHALLADAKLRTPAKEFAQSTHRDDRIGCVGCHKGDPQDPTVGAHKAAGFDPHPTHAEVPVICGGCHSDATFMRQFNGRIPIGQASLFQLSVHGKLTAAGDTSAPSCADCHGQHGIVSSALPSASTSRLNVAKLCGGCHSDEKRMGKYKIPTDQLDKWQKSVHGQAFRSGNTIAPTCTSCHGAHANAPPNTASVGHTCDRCHEDELSFFEQSPHSKGFRQRGFTPCVVCHGSHDVAPATELLVGTTANAACMKCHSNDEKPRKVATEIASLLTAAQQKAAEARDAVKRATGKGLHVSGAAYALDKLATSELKLRGVVHTLDAARVQSRASDVEHDASEALRFVDDAERARQVEKRGYYVALALAALLFTLLTLKALQLDRRKPESR